MSHHLATSIALDHVRKPLRETHGKNRSPEIDLMLSEVGAPLGSPYCAAGVSHCFRGVSGEPGERFPIFTASSQAMRRAFEARERLFRDPNLLLRVRGALFGWTNADRVHGHVGIVFGRLTINVGGKTIVKGIQTLEYNTGLRGDRDGEGAFALIRRLGGDGLWYVEDSRGRLVGRPRRLWFLNTTGISGGSWWR